jgi:hypothetical protein
MEGVSLKWMPTDSVGNCKCLDPSGLRGLHIGEIHVVDKREHPQIIGMNTQQKDKGLVRYVRTADDVSAWCRRVLAAVLPRLGIAVGAQGFPLLQCTINRFSVDEGKMYEGVADMTFALYRNDSTWVWKSTYATTSQSWGSSYSLKNYLERLCDSFLGDMHSLLSDTSFVRALRETQADTSH